jgi:hypothetical protein
MEIESRVERREEKRTKVIIMNKPRLSKNSSADCVKPASERRRNSDHSIFTRASDTSNSCGGRSHDFGKLHCGEVIRYSMERSMPAYNKRYVNLTSCSVSSSSADLPPKKSQEIVSLSMKQGLLASKEDDCYAIRRTDGGRAFSNGLNIKIKPSKKKKENKLILRDDDKRFIAVCSKESLETGGFIYRIFSCRPMLPGQKPAKKTSNSRMGLYEWAEVVGAPHDLHYPMCVWDGANYEPTYIAKRGISSRRFIFEKANRPAGLMERTQDQWKVEVAPNMDPCLLLLFAAIADDLNQHEKESAPQPSLRDVAMLVNGMMADSTYLFNRNPDKVKVEGVGQSLGVSPNNVAAIMMHTHQPPTRQQRRESLGAA